MENLFKVYDRVVAETMWFIMNHSKEKNNGRVVVEVNPNEPETMYLFHCAANVSTLFDKSVVYVDCSFWDYIKMWHKYRKYITLKPAKKKDEPFDFMTSCAAAARENKEFHVIWMYKDIYEEFYKGDSKW